MSPKLCHRPQKLRHFVSPGTLLICLTFLIRAHNSLNTLDLDHFLLAHTIWHDPCIETFLMCQEATISLLGESPRPGPHYRPAPLLQPARSLVRLPLLLSFFCEQMFLPKRPITSRNYLCFIPSHLQRFKRIITAQTRRFLRIINVNAIRKGLSLLYLTANSIFIRASAYIWKAQLNNSRRLSNESSTNPSIPSTHDSTTPSFPAPAFRPRT